jgi:MoaA/NifB/PqqE/SkfB family radical SAM enzyme
MGWMRKHEALSRFPDLLLRGRFSFTFDGIPIVAEGLSPCKRINLLKAGMDMMLGKDHAWALPPVIQIEPTNICNLRCPLCPTGSDSTTRSKGFMSYATFRRILDEIGESLVFAVLYGWGEPFLNQDLPRMIDDCTARNIRTLTSTNGHCLQTLDEALRIVDARLTVLIIAIDGSTQEIYDAYRKCGNVEKVKRCAALIEDAKAKRGSPFPYTNLRVVLTRRNQDDLPNLEKLARDIGVNMFSCKSLGALIENKSFRDFEPELARMRRFEYHDSIRKRRPPVKCPYPFRQPTVFWDGTLVGCEYDYDLLMPWGRLDHQSFDSAWNHIRAQTMRRSIREGPGRPKFCDACPYRDRVQDACVLACKELRPLQA